VIKASQRCPCG